MNLADFSGVWRLTREIEDRRSGLVGHLSGTAEWRPEGPGLVQVERGLLRYGDGPPMQAERRYLWREETDGIAVYFDHGRPFHWFSAEIPTAHHDCPPDIYDVTYDFADLPRWCAVWEVLGPRKNYRMESRYRQSG